MNSESVASIIALLRKNTEKIQAKHARKAKRNKSGKKSKIDKTPPTQDRADANKTR